MKVSNAAPTSPAAKAAMAGPTNCRPRSSLAGTANAAGRRWLEQDQAGNQIGALERELQPDLAARRMSDPVDALESRGSRRARRRDAHDRRLSGDEMVPSAITRPPHPNHTARVERRRGTDGREPVAEDAGVDKKHRLALTALGEADVCVVNRKGVHGCRL